MSLLTSEEIAELGLEEEEAACRKAGLEFRSLPIPDRQVPAGNALPFARGLHEALSRGHSIAIHCRMGIGRSSLIAAAVLQLCGVAPEEALSRLSASRGLTVPDTEEQRRWILDLARS